MKDEILNCKTVGDLRNLNLENATELEKKIVETLNQSFWSFDKDELLSKFMSSTEFISLGKSVSGEFYITYYWDAGIPIKEAFDYIKEGSLDSANSWWKEEWTDIDDDEIEIILLTDEEKELFLNKNQR